MNVKQRAIFVDRDGVVNKLIYREAADTISGNTCWTAPYTYREFQLLPNVKESLNIIRQIGFLSILVTNQPDVSYGFLSLSDYNQIMADVSSFSFDDIYVCRHMRSEECECRKPKPGMLLAAAGKWNIDLSKSYFIGDTEKDLRAAQAVGCNFILVRAEYNTEIVVNQSAASFFDAIALIQKLEDCS